MPKVLGLPKMALAKSIELDASMMHVHLSDGRIISVPIMWFPILWQASAEERLNFEIGAGGRGLHWPELDEDISVAGLLAGGDWQAA
ncbi:MAG: DUF2442 domain-containing protein [Deinococcales bacterium]